MWYLNSTEWYLVETNYDHWLPDPPKDDRRCGARALCECALTSDRTIAQAALNQVGEADINLSTLWKVLSVPQGAPFSLPPLYVTHPDSPQRRHHVHRRDRSQQWHAHHLRSLSASHVLSSQYTLSLAVCRNVCGGDIRFA